MARPEITGRAPNSLNNVGAEAVSAPQPEIAAPPDSLADDLLLGAEAIAEFLLGDRSKKKRRKVYHLRPHLPLFYLGGEIAGRKSTLRQFIAAQEQAATDAA
jgi:hypothetical protein